MKFADGPMVEVDVHIDARPDRVWELVTDIGLPARFSSEFQGADWLDGDGPRLGARFVGRNHHPSGAKWESTSVVVACEPERLFAWAVGHPDQPMASWRFELDADATGTRLRQRAQLGPGRSRLTGVIEARPDKEERIVALRLEELRANMQATVEGIKAVAEGRAA